MSSFYHGFYGKSFTRVCVKFRKKLLRLFLLLAIGNAANYRPQQPPFVLTASTHRKGTFRDAAVTSRGQPILDFLTLFEANLLLLSKAGWFPGGSLEAHQPRL